MQQGLLNVSLEDMIRNAVVASWRDLMPDDGSPQLHVEYHRTAPNEEVQYLKIWAAEGKGGWRLVCQYWVSTTAGQPGHGLTFCQPFSSANFEQLLTAVLENQKTFSDLQEQTRDGLIQIFLPTEDERTAALTAIQTALADRHVREAEPLDGTLDSTSPPRRPQN